MHYLSGDTRTWLISGAILTGAIAVALVIHFALFFVAGRLLRRKATNSESLLAKRAKKSTLLIFPLLALVLAAPFAPIPADLKSILEHALGLGVIASIGWAIIILTELAGNIIFARYSMDSPDNLGARRIRTQTQVLQRIATLTVSIVTVSVMLMTFPAVRHLGVSLLASFRGWIEEINTTYVVMRLWDLRRLVVPLSYFIEKPFQNWTRTTADLLATAMIYVDYTAPITELREELHRILESTELWIRRPGPCK